MEFSPAVRHRRTHKREALIEAVQYDLFASLRRTPCRAPGAVSAKRFAAPYSRTDANKSRKHARKMALIGKPGRYRDLDQRQASDRHQLLGRLYALLKEPLVWRQTGGGPKRA